MDKVRVVAEIGANHQGDIDIAKKMIRLAADFCMVDVVKFTKRNIRECLTPGQYGSPHPNPIHAFGETYGRHREFLEFTIEQHGELKEYANYHGVEYACTACDVTSVKELAGINPAYIKIGSGHNQRFELYDALKEYWDGDIHISTGATTKVEVRKIVDYFKEIDNPDRLHNLVLYACTSSYPTDVKDLCLLEIDNLKKHGVRVGFSGHHTGIAPDMAAATLGVNYLERHFTLNRAWKGTDHAASMEADGLRRICKYIRDIQTAMTYKEQDILECELSFRAKNDK